MNIQPVEGISKNEKLDIVSIFDTIQGEGPFAGTPAVFVRTAGCNLQCPACDTDYTSNRKTMTVGAIVEEIRKVSVRLTGLVVITGGEPFRQPMGLLTDSLIAGGFKPQIETNGLLFQEGLNPNVSIVCSPKTEKIHPKIVHWITAYKYVVQAGHIGVDGLPLNVLGVKCHAARPHSRHTPVYVQPLDEGDVAKNKANTQAAMLSCMQHGYILCLQIHKIVGLD